MRICIVSPPLDTFGGAERVIVSDARRFAEDGNDVHIISNRFDREVLTEYRLGDAVDCHRYSESTVLPTLFYRAKHIRRLLKNIDPDVVISHYREKPTWLALLTLRSDIHCITHVHGSLLWFEDSWKRLPHLGKECLKEIIDDVPGHSEFWYGNRFSRKDKVIASVKESVEAKALRSCDAVVVNNRQVARELNCLYGVDAEVNPPGVDLPERMPPDSDIAVDEPFIFSLSRLDSRKRIDLLIRAFAELKRIRPDVHLVIGGAGDEENHLRQLVRREGIEESVEFIGFIEEDRVLSYYSNAEIFACPAWMSYGLTPLEAVRANTKVAISTDAYANELIKGENGVAVIPPEVDQWVIGLRELLDCDCVPSSATVPTVGQHTRKKMELLYNL